MTLKTARKIAQLTQTQLAEKSGVDQATISALENGLIGRPSYETVARIAQALNVTAEDLFPFKQQDAR